jgi:hypothetical protein
MGSAPCHIGWLSFCSIDSLYFIYSIGHDTFRCQIYKEGTLVDIPTVIDYLALGILSAPSFFSFPR